MDYLIYCIKCGAPIRSDKINFNFNLNFGMTRLECHCGQITHIPNHIGRQQSDENKQAKMDDLLIECTECPEMIRSENIADSGICYDFKCICGAKFMMVKHVAELESKKWHTERNYKSLRDWGRSISMRPGIPFTFKSINWEPPKHEGYTAKKWSRILRESIAEEAKRTRKVMFNSVNVPPYMLGYQMPNCHCYNNTLDECISKLNNKKEREMKSPTMDIAKKAKDELEGKLLSLISKFEEETGMKVDGAITHRTENPSEPGIAHVEVEAYLP